MSQSELASKLATQKLYTNVKAYSHRRGVNVIIGSKTLYYGRAYGGMKVADHVRAVVEDAVTEYSRGTYDSATWSILASAGAFQRGEYRFSVWMPKTREEAT